VTVLVAPDSFKGTFRSPEVAAAVGRGLKRAGYEPDLAPAADGGDGTMEVLLLALGGETAAAEVQDPLGRPVTAAFGLLEGGAAIVEMAQASGLQLVDERERDAEAARTYGTGELILAATEAGADVVYVSVGGSATTDGGAGAIDAIEAGGGLGGAKLVVLCDVRTPFERAAEVYAPQKGASAAAVRRLTRRLNRLAEGWSRDPRGQPLTGAAGGLSGGLWAALGASLVPGAPFVLDALHFDERLRSAGAVVTGEGHLDAQTLQGKVVGEVATRARQRGVPCNAVVGGSSLDRFGRRMLDLDSVVAATMLPEIEEAAAALGVDRLPRLARR
jgi:glycerate 2-kinase